ncbi:MAG: hypothetical protein WC133_06140 [Candidatus Omnitrophota bacterium]
MKKTLKLLSMLIFVFLLLGKVFAGSEYELKDGTFIHHDLRFQFQIPSEWNAKLGRGQGMILSLEKFPTLIGLACWPVEKNVTLEQELEKLKEIDRNSQRQMQWLSELKKEKEGVKIVEVISLAGANPNNENSRELKQKMLYFMRERADGQSYMCSLAFMTFPDRYSKDVSDFDSLLETLAFKKP